MPRLPRLPRVAVGDVVYHVITAGPRLEKIAKDFVEHYATEWESGKAMFVAIDKITTVRMHQLIEKFWSEKIEELRKATAFLIEPYRKLLKTDFPDAESGQIAGAHMDVL